LPGHAVAQLQRQDAHADEIAAMNPLETRRDDRPNAEQHRAFRRPVAAAAGSVFRPGQHEERHSRYSGQQCFGLITHGGIINGHDFRLRASDFGVVIRYFFLKPEA